MHSNQDLLVIVHVHENEAELSRILSSIKENSSLANCTLLVINNATDVGIAKNLSVICGAYANISLELNQFNWPIVRRRIAGYFGNEYLNDHVSWLNKLDLGANGWNVHHARNIGMVIARLCYPRKKYILNFDSDILVPQALHITCPSHSKLTCLQIQGCPDLSRVEWMIVYLFFLSVKYGAPCVNFQDHYSHTLATKVSPEVLGSILTTYSSFELEEKFHPATDSLAFPTREEYHGACYFISTAELGRCSYPWWYDNDWFFFKEIRKDAEQLQFIDQFVTHKSARKQVLDKNALKLEEEGQILNIMYESLQSCIYSEAEVCKLAAARRAAIVSEVLQLAHSLMSKPLSMQERDQLDAIASGLRNLLTLIETLDGESMIRQLKTHEAFQREWQGAFKYLATINSQTSGILEAVHNLCEI